MGRPAMWAGSRGRIEPEPERAVSLVPFAFRFDAGLARRFATPIDVAAAPRCLC